MKPVALIVVLGVAVASNALAQTGGFPPAPPPPGMNDPGVKAVSPPAPTPVAQPAPSNQPTQSAKPGQSSVNSATAAAQPTLPSMQDPRDATGQTPPQVTVHRQSDDSIVQEYRRSGQLYMVVVTPKNGISQTYMVDQKGAWTNPGGEPVKPVMYKVLEWGKGKSAEDQDNGGQ
jgi:hypothetical protein